ncbi:hypothetical protein VSK90_08580 [Bacillus swezeyi]
MGSTKMHEGLHLSFKEIMPMTKVTLYTEDRGFLMKEECVKGH